MAQVRDRAGNVGLVRYAARRARARQALRGSPGVTVRYLAGQAPDPRRRRAARGRRCSSTRGVAPTRWRLHRLGQRETLLRGRSRRPLLRLRMPRRPSGVYLLELRSGTHRAKRAARRQTDPVARRCWWSCPLVTWQGRNQVDDDGDGLPNTLETGGPVRVARPFAGSGVPPGFARHEGPLLRLPRPPPPALRPRRPTTAGARADQSYLDRYGGVVHGRRRPLAASRGWPRACGATWRAAGACCSLGTRVAAARRAGAERPARAADAARRPTTSFGSRDRTPLPARKVDLLAADRRDRAVRGRRTARSPASTGYEATRSPARGAPHRRGAPRRRRGARSSSRIRVGQGPRHPHRPADVRAAGGRPPTSPPLIAPHLEVLS